MKGIIKTTKNKMNRKELLQSIDSNDLEGATWKQLEDLMGFAWAKLSRIERAYMYAKKLNRIITHTDETEELIQKLCQSICEDADVYSDFFNRIDAEKDKRVRGLLRKKKEDETCDNTTNNNSDQKEE